MASRQVVNVAGLVVNVYGKDELRPCRLGEGAPLTVLILVHGILDTSECMDETAQDAFRRRGEVLGREFIVVSMDLRNHGHRLVSSEANRPWHTSRAGRHNPTYAIDATGVVAGTAQDISFIMDFLPAYLFPAGERKVVHWAAAGISMGSHVVWFALRSDPRLKTGIIILGCPDNFIVLRTHAAMIGLPFAPPHVPETLLGALRKFDPTCANYRACMSTLNPFWGKNILNVCADEDTSVPVSMYADFWKALEVGPNGRKETVMLEGGHVYTRTMMKHALRFFWERCLGEESKVRAHL